MSDSLFGGSGVPETYIGQLQDKLIRAGYLRSSFEPEVFDAASKNCSRRSYGRTQ